MRSSGAQPEAPPALSSAGQDPQAIAAWIDLARTLLARGELDESERLLRQLLNETPALAQAHALAGGICIQRQQWRQGAVVLRRALELDPSLVAAHVDLATCLFNQLRSEEAHAHLQQAIRLAPSNAMIRAAQVVRRLPMVARTIEESGAAAGAFESAVSDYGAWRHSCQEAGVAIEGDMIPLLPFLLAYRDGNHLQPLSRFADTVGPPPRFTAPRSPAARGKVRLGIVSAHFRRHSVWNVITKGILKHIDRDRFEVRLYHVGATEDEETAVARSLSDRWLDTQAIVGASRWAAAIAADEPDVLLYPEIGMDMTTYLVARERLAPVQAVSWGHPITSGLSTMDLYLSGDLLEPPQAQSHYRERLVRLPGTGVCMTPWSVPEDAPARLLNELAARPGPTIFIPQMSIKFDPRFDEVLARTAQAVGPCTMVIPCHPAHRASTHVLVDRLGAAFATLGCDADAVLKLVPWMTQGQFNALLDASDAVLDCPFSGYTTAWLAAHRGAPLVTMTGEFLRHRLATGLHQQLGITDTVVKSREDYVQVAAAVALEGRDSPAGRQRRHAIRAAASALDTDVAVMRALELALLQALDEQRPAVGA